LTIPGLKIPRSARFSASRWKAVVRGNKNWETAVGKNTRRRVSHGRVSFLAEAADRMEGLSLAEAK
jgi:hypothetical protein